MKKLVKPIIGRARQDAVLNFAISVVFFGLLMISAYAVLQGLMDIISVSQPALASGFQRFYIGAAAVLITAAMWVTLEVALSRGNLPKRVLAAGIYVLLALWSIGFGYGFWWKIIASRTETLAAIQGAATSVASQIQQTNAAVNRLEGSLEGVSAIALQQQNIETKSGGSCGIPSGPGFETLAKRRKVVTDEIDNLTNRIQARWIGPINVVLYGTPLSDGSLSGGLQGELKRLDPKVMRELSADQRAQRFTEVRDASARAITRIDALNQQQGSEAVTELANLSRQLGVQRGERAFTCYDPQLASALADAATQAKSPPRLSLPVFENSEGAAATAKAFQKIWSYAFWAVGLAASWIGLIAAPRDAVSLGGNDLIALIASCVIDICIFVFGVLRTRRPLDGSRLLQPSSDDSRDKLMASLKAFAADDALDARRVFTACIIRAGNRYYFILPHLSSRMSSKWRPRAMFLQNILLVFEEVRAVDRSYEPTGLRAALRSLLRRGEMTSLFEDAAKQLREATAAIDTSASTATGDAQISEGQTTDAGAPNASDLSLHRFRPGDLLEILLLLREGPSEVGSRSDTSPLNWLWENAGRFRPRPSRQSRQKTSREEFVAAETPRRTSSNPEQDGEAGGPRDVPLDGFDTPSDSEEQAHQATSHFEDGARPNRLFGFGEFRRARE